jgi:hypothetical protein
MPCRALVSIANTSSSDVLNGSKNYKSYIFFILTYFFNYYFRQQVGIYSNFDYVLIH